MPRITGNAHLAVTAKDMELARFLTAPGFKKVLRFPHPKTELRG
jgi:very-short-patch-repair endonuclease